MTETQKVTYWATSFLLSKTFWINFVTFLVGVLQLTDVVAVIPSKYNPQVLACLGIMNMGLRFMTQRPITVSMPGTVTPVLVNKLPDAPSSLISESK